MTETNTPNPTLKGHKLLLLLPCPTPQSTLDALQTKFPNLQVVARQRPFKYTNANGELSVDEWKDVTVLVTGSAVPDVGVAPRLEYVQLTSAGINHLANRSLFRDTDVSFCTANGVHGPQIAEWVLATFLALQHNLPQYLEFQREARWHRLDDEKPDDSYGKRVGILGYGSIGRQIARVCKAMGMSIHAYTLHPKDTPDSRRDNSYSPPGLGDPDGSLPDKWFSGTSTQALHEFLSSNLDLIVIAVPLTNQTRHMIGRAEFAAMSRHGSRRAPFLSNVARGPIVVTDDLVVALEKGTIRGAALDVTDPEPLPGWHPLWEMRNVIITPHASGACVTYYDRVLKILEMNLERLGRGEELVNRVNREEGY